ncbi:MAG TPA: potassium channel family protein [Bacteroidia bacterium]|nr:potassium channel family protein [Bacteroidia bacterium]
MFKKLFRLLARGDDDSYLAFFFIFLVIAVFIMGPLDLNSRFRFYSQPVFSLMVITGVFATTGSRWMRSASIGLAILDFMVSVINSYFDRITFEVLDVAITGVALMFLTGAILTRVFRDGEVNFYRIIGSVCAYILVGLIWGFAYYIFFLFDPSAFLFSGKVALPHSIAMYDLSYFSFVTLFTVGYGDILPFHPFVRSLTTLEGLIGQLYPAILIARLVSMEIEMNRGKGK